MKSNVFLVDAVIVVYWLFTLVLQLVFAGRIVGAGEPLAGLLLLDVGMIGVVAGVVGFSQSRPFKERVLWRLPVVIAAIYAGFASVGAYIRQVNPNDMEAQLIWFDKLLMGATFGEWVEPHQVTWVTDVLQLCYSSYYFLPLILFLILFRKGREVEALHMTTAIAVAFFTSYVFYLLVPARSPYVIAESLDAGHLVSFGGPLDGSGITVWLRHALHTAEANKRDCFPSGHTYISLVVLFSAWRYQRRVFLPYLFVISGLILGTLYLRYHYVIDLVVGALLAWLVMKSIPDWNRKWLARSGEPVVELK